MVNKEFVVEVLNTECLTGILMPEHLLQVIASYCLEKGKSEDDTGRFIKAVSHHPLMTDYFLYAMNFYKRKFDIVELAKPVGPGYQTLFYY